MGLFSNSSGDFASIKQINALQNQIDTLQKMINIQQKNMTELGDALQKSIELSSQMAVAVDNHENKIDKIGDVLNSFMDCIESSKDTILELDSRLHTLEQQE